MFALELRLLTGRYVATSYNDRRRPEWPPHPARLYSALVATHFAAEEPDPIERLALEWLESLGAPALSASKAEPRDDYITFVPVNDLTVVGDFSKQEGLLAAAEAALVDLRWQVELAAADPKQQEKLKKALYRAEEQARGAHEKLRATVAEKTGVPTKVGKDDPGRAVALLPERRIRQPRRSPGVTPESPVVQFVWPNAEAVGYADVFDRLAARVVRLGHSSSFVSLRVVNEPSPPNHLPVEAGPLRLRVVQAGQLQRLEAAFALHRETEPRIMSKSFQDYSPPPKPESAIPASVLSEDWLVLERASGPLLPATRGPDIAQAVRNALLSHAAEPLEVLTGRQLDGSPSRDAHVAIVPLPFVGHLHADGLLRGVAIVLPRKVGLEEKTAVFQAMRRWEEAARAGGDDSDAPPLPLRLGDAGVMSLRRVDYVPELQTLRPATWCGPSCAWASVMPVALDRNPGDLHSRDPEKLANAVREAEDCIRQACGHIGLPEPAHVEVLPFAPWAGGYKAKRFAPFPREEGRVRRMLTHVHLEFAEPVRGPVILGAGRFLGLGLCKPLVRGDQ